MLRAAMHLSLSSYEKHRGITFRGVGYELLFMHYLMDAGLLFHKMCVVITACDKRAIIAKAG